MGRRTMSGSNTPWAQGPANLTVKGFNKWPKSVHAFAYILSLIWLTATFAKCIHDVAWHGVFATETDDYACYAAMILA